MLSADELGEKGESRFRELCADAGLICNKSDRDRTGWDFLVEFPYESQTSISLDNRTAPISCFVQVKTIRFTSKRVQMKLSVAERLAKEIRPAFICIFRVGAKNDFLDAFLIHVLDDKLAFILRRLRQEEAFGTDHQKINQKMISWTLNANERIEVRGASLRSRIVAACQNDTSEYTKKKEDQLKKLGFESNQFFLDLSMISKIEEIGDVLLGLKALHPARIDRFGEERFGITLGKSVGKDVNISLIPTSTDYYSLQFRPEDGVQPALFDSTCFQISLPPPLELQNRVLFKSQLFHLQFSIADEENTTIKLESIYKETDRFSISVWINYWRMVQIIESGTGELLLTRRQDHSLSRLPIACFGKQQTSGDHFFELCTKFEFICRQAGVFPEPNVSLRELLDKSDHINSIYRIMCSEAPDQIIESPFDEEIEKTDYQAPIFAARLNIGELTIGCYAIVSLSGVKEDDLIRWHVVKVTPKLARQIDAAEKEFASFVEHAKKFEKIDAAIIYSDIKDEP